MIEERFVVAIDPAGTDDGGMCFAVAKGNRLVKILGFATLGRPLPDDDSDEDEPEGR